MGAQTFFEDSAHMERQAEKAAIGSRTSGQMPKRNNSETDWSASPAFPLMSRLRKFWRISQFPVLLGLFGGVALAAGADAPLIHIPIVGTISYLSHPGYFTCCTIGELIILATAILSIVFALLKRFKALWMTGMLALAQLIMTVAMFQRTATTIVAKADQPDLVDPTLMWAGAALRHAHFEWGVTMVAGGALMVLAAAAWELRAARRKENVLSGGVESCEAANELLVDNS
jgi:hypothetical protein